MIEHPIPQNVTSYQFHLVGDMTLKQFVELAAGIVLAWIIWSLGLPQIFKLPLTAIAALLGFALAFLPVEDRPLDQWILSFLKAIYGPTILLWRRSGREDFLSFKPHAQNHAAALDAATKAPSAQLESLLANYRAATAGTGVIDPLEEPWTARQKRIPDLFSTVAASPAVTVSSVTQPAVTTIAKPSLSPRPLRPVEEVSAIPAQRSISIPATTPSTPDVSPPTVDAAAVILPPPTVAPLSTAAPTTPAAPPMATLSPHAATVPLPAAPSMPNMLTGIVFGKEGHIVDNAILELRDSSRLPIRALKTNQLGQFSIATPLPNGVYDLEIEKEGESFDILKIEAKGEIIPPIEIRAKAVVSSK